MLKYIIYCLWGIAVVLVASSCNTIEDRDSLGAKADLSQIHLTAVSTTSPDGKNGNQIVVTNTTPQYGGQWNLLVKRSTKMTDTVILPFRGNVTLPYLATTAGGLVKDSVVVKIDTVDHPIDPAYALLAGTSSAGKTWVWGTGNPESTGHNIWAVGSKDNAPASPSWWGVPNDATAASQNIDMNGTMTFDLNGAANFTKVENGVTTHGNFSFDFSRHNSVLAIGTLSFTNTTILKGISQNDGGIVVYTFDIMKLDENELFLGYPDHNPGESWYWVFKRQGYTFP